MSYSSPLSAFVALGVVAILSVGTAAPAAAGFFDWWPFGRKAAEEPIPDPLPYTVTMDIQGGDRKLQKALRRASGLLEREDTPPSGLTGLIARARQDVGRLTAVLYENALYAAEVFITIDGRPLATIGPFDSVGAPPVPVAVTVITGSPFVFGAIETGPLPRGVNLQKLGLVRGAPAGSLVVIRGEAAIVEGWREQGHPLAQARPRDTIADHRNNELDVTFHVDPGPIAYFGQVSVVGADRVRQSFILKRAEIGDGVYSSTITKRAETRLRDLGAFESVRITHPDRLSPDGTIPIVITVSERKRHVIGGTVAYSNTEGPSFEVFWRDRNLFGGAERLEFRASVSRIITDAFEQDYRVGGTFTKPAIIGPMTDFTFRAEAYRETNEAYGITAAEIEAGLAQEFSDTVYGSAGIELQRSRTTDDEDVTTDHLLLTLNSELVWDTRDNRLDPSDGFRAMITAAPSYDFLQDKAFATFGGDLSVYHGIGPTDRFVLAGRVAAQTLTVDNINNVAPDRRIYLGGAGTVRGYGFKNIAPRDAEGDIIGGRSSILFSGEVRYRLTEQFGIVAFVDAGNAYSSILPGIDGLKVGIGAGVRYITPVGPVRLDLAVPLQPEDGDPAVAVYVGLGQAF